MPSMRSIGAVDCFQRVGDSLPTRKHCNNAHSPIFVFAFYDSDQSGIPICSTASKAWKRSAVRSRPGPHISPSKAVGARAAEVRQAVGLGGLQAIDGLRQHQRQRVLARPARPGQNQRLRKAFRANALAQMRDGRRVAEKILKARGLSLVDREHGRRHFSRATTKSGTHSSARLYSESAIAASAWRLCSA